MTELASEVLFKWNPTVDSLNALLHNWDGTKVLMLYFGDTSSFSYKFGLQFNLFFLNRLVQYFAHWPLIC